MSSSGAPTAALPATDGKASAASPPALLSQSRVKQSAATARPWYDTSDINAADRKYRSDSAVRKSEDWL